MYQTLSSTLFGIFTNDVSRPQWQTNVVEHVSYVYKRRLGTVFGTFTNEGPQLPRPLIQSTVSSRLDQDGNWEIETSPTMVGGPLLFTLMERLQTTVGDKNGTIFSLLVLLLHDVCCVLIMFWVRSSALLVVLPLPSNTAFPTALLYRSFMTMETVARQLLQRSRYRGWHRPCWLHWRIQMRLRFGLHCQRWVRSCTLGSRVPPPCIGEPDDHRCIFFVWILCSLMVCCHNSKPGFAFHFCDFYCMIGALQPINSRSHWNM